MKYSTVVVHLALILSGHPLKILAFRQGITATDLQSNEESQSQAKTEMSGKGFSGVDLQSGEESHSHAHGGCGKGQNRCCANWKGVFDTQITLLSASRPNPTQAGMEAFQFELETAIAKLVQSQQKAQKCDWFVKKDYDVEALAQIDYDLTVLHPCRKTADKLAVGAKSLSGEEQKKEYAKAQAILHIDAEEVQAFAKKQGQTDNQVCESRAQVLHFGKPLQEVASKDGDNGELDLDEALRQGESLLETDSAMVATPGALSQLHANTSLLHQPDAWKAACRMTLCAVYAVVVLGWKIFVGFLFVASVVVVGTLSAAYCIGNAFLLATRAFFGLLACTIGRGLRGLWRKITNSKKESAFGSCMKKWIGYNASERSGDLMLGSTSLLSQECSWTGAAKSMELAAVWKDDWAMVRDYYGTLSDYDMTYQEYY